MRHTYTSILVHYVFSTKRCAGLIVPDLRRRLPPYLAGIALYNHMKVLAVGVTRDHVHILVSLAVTLSVAKAVQLIKGGSSKWIHDTFVNMNDFAWQEEYGAFTIGQSQAEATVAYINNQEAHHRRQTFEEEWRLFLKKHGFSIDPERDPD